VVRVGDGGYALAGPYRDLYRDDLEEVLVEASGVALEREASPPAFL